MKVPALLSALFSSASCFHLCSHNHKLTLCETRLVCIMQINRTHEIVEITYAQVDNFCGNIQEMKGSHSRKLMAMSTRAFHAFTQQQRDTLLRHVDALVHADIPTIENIGGGGVRCMMAELF